MASRRHALWLLPASFGAAGLTLFGVASPGTAMAQPPGDSCMNALAALPDLSNLGFPDIASLFGPGVTGPGVNINSGNNISIQTGPSNFAPGQFSSVGNNGGQNTNNVTTCCVNGRCCVVTDGGTANCTP